jgi:hypothetical protein
MRRSPPECDDRVSVHLMYQFRWYGYEIELGRSGAPDIKGYSQECLDASSPHRQQIVAAVREGDGKQILSPTEVLSAHRQIAAEFGNQAEAVVAQAQLRRQDRTHGNSLEERRQQANSALAPYQQTLPVRIQASPYRVARRMVGSGPAEARTTIMAGRPLSHVATPITPFLVGSNRIKRRRTIAASLRNGSESIIPVVHCVRPSQGSVHAPAKGTARSFFNFRAASATS